MKKIILIICVLVAISCNSIKHNSFKNIYIKDYKLNYFRGCLKYGFNNSAEINSVLNSDRSGYGEPILGDNYRTIDSLARITAEEIKKDSANSIGRVPQEIEGKKVLDKCLCEYNSKWLEKRAKAAFKKYKQQDKEFYKQLKK